MKKTLLALSVLAGSLSATAQAAEIYNNEGTSIDLNGRFYSIVETKKTDDSTNTDVRADDSRIGLSLRHEVNDSFALIGMSELQYNSSNGDAFDTRDLWAGFDFANVGQLTFGRSNSLLDDYGLLGGFDEYYGQSQEIEDASRTNSRVKFISAPLFDVLQLGASYKANNSDAEAPKEGGELLALVNLDFGLALSATYLNYDYKGNGDNETGFNLGAKYTMSDVFAVGADYAQKQNVNGFDNVERSAWRAGGEYVGLTDFRIYGGLGEVTTDIDGVLTGADLTDGTNSGFYAGVSYNIIPNAYVFAEYASYDKETGSDEDMLGLGLSLNF